MPTSNLFTCLLLVLFCRFSSAQVSSVRTYINTSNSLKGVRWPKGKDNLASVLIDAFLMGRMNAYKFNIDSIKSEYLSNETPALKEVMSKTDYFAETRYLNYAMSEITSTVWDSSKKYVLGDRVLVEGEVFTALRDNDGFQPKHDSLNYWLPAGPLYDTVGAVEMNDLVLIGWLNKRSSSKNGIEILGIGSDKIARDHPTYYLYFDFATCLSYLKSQNRVILISCLNKAIPH
jgi:hypothetical protein